MGWHITSQDGHVSVTWGPFDPAGARYFGDGPTAQAQALAWAKAQGYGTVTITGAPQH